MDAAITLPEQEHKILKEKYNCLIDRYFALQKENERLKSQIKEEASQSCTPNAPEDTFCSFFSSYIAIIRKALDTEVFIPYTYASKNAKNYLKIEKSAFEQLIMENTAIPLKAFKDYCCGFMLIKSENNKCIFTNDRQTVYYINKTILDCIVTDTIASAVKENA